MTGLCSFSPSENDPGWSYITGQQNTGRKQREKSSEWLRFPVLNTANMVSVYRAAVTLETKGQSDDFTRWKRGHGKPHWHFSSQQFKNNTRRSISVTFTAMGKATNITSKAHYAIFLRGEAARWKGFFFLFFFFPRPLHVPTNFSIQQHFPISALLSQTWKGWTSSAVWKNKTTDGLRWS